MLTPTTAPARPEVAGRLKLAERHRRIADSLGWSRRTENSPRRHKHRSKAQKHEARAAALAAAWRAQHPERSDEI